MIIFLLQQIVQNLPSDIANIITALDKAELEKLEEVRLRRDRPVVISLETVHKKLPVIAEKSHIDICMQKISKSSVYAYLDEIQNGFITIDGGHRVGITGRVVLKDNSVYNIKNISGINFRIAREIIGCANSIMPLINSKKVNNTLIISPPQCGKTTMLRDVARQLGREKKISIIDERGEIAAMFNGSPQYDIGDMTDVIDLCPKSIGITLMLRSMSPDIILTDEITQNDIPSIRQALFCGVKFIATAHGDDVLETLHRLAISDIIDCFGSIILLGRENGKIVIKNTYEGRDFIAGKDVGECNCGNGIR